MFLNYGFPWIFAQQWDYNTMGYYSAIKKNEIMSFAATWMGLETAMLREVSQTLKMKYHMTFLICRT